MALFRSGTACRRRNDLHDEDLPERLERTIAANIDDPPLTARRCCSRATVRVMLRSACERRTLTARGTSSAAVELRSMMIARELARGRPARRVADEPIECRACNTTNRDREHRRAAGCCVAVLRSIDGPTEAAPPRRRCDRRTSTTAWDVERRGRTAADDDRGLARSQTSCDGPSNAAQHMRSTNINGPGGTSRAAVALRPIHHIADERIKYATRNATNRDREHEPSPAQPIDVTPSSPRWP